MSIKQWQSEYFINKFDVIISNDAEVKFSLFDTDITIPNSQKHH